MNDLEILIAGVVALMGVGLYGLLFTRNLIKVVVALQILVKGVLVAMTAAGEASGQLNLSQTLIMTVIVADTIVAVVGLAFAVQVKRLFGTLDLQALSNLRG
ncbi:MAG: NADH-quinone oxidoreductase subunit K [Anaerolineae bacterium]|jgi:NADH-quinone oxidoreductase subunit K|nr:NADH-quinone oxidoreductase subunit K [Anaerolineae bacterium]